MPAPVVLVHDDLEAVEQAETVRVVVTRDNFTAPNDLNGLSLFLVARRRRPDLKAVFVCGGETEQLAASYGPALSASVAPADFVRAAQELLA